MNRYDSLIEKFNKREKVLGTTCQMLMDPMVIAKLNRSDLDFILFDCEHGRYDAQNLVPILHECRMMGLPSVVRIQDAFYHLAAKPLDMGADGIMVPRTESVEQLKQVVDGLCFFPIGRKGNGGVAQFMPKESIEHFNKSRFLLPQIESPKGIENLPKMLDTYGNLISAIMVGPYDMSVMVGTPLDIYSKTMTDSVKKVFDIAASYGKSCGIYCNDYDDAIHFKELGANVFWAGADMQFLQLGMDNIFSKLDTL